MAVGRGSPGLTPLSLQPADEIVGNIKNIQRSSYWKDYGGHFLLEQLLSSSARRGCAKVPAEIQISLVDTYIEIDVKMNRSGKEPSVYT